MSPPQSSDGPTAAADLRYAFSILANIPQKQEGRAVKYKVRKDKGLPRKAKVLSVEVDGQHYADLFFE